jgi:hypothetical protein
MGRGIRDLKAVSVRKELNSKGSRHNQSKYFFGEWYDAGPGSMGR